MAFFTLDEGGRDEKKVPPPWGFLAFLRIRTSGEN